MKRRITLIILAAYLLLGCDLKVEIVTSTPPQPVDSPTIPVCTPDNEIEPEPIPTEEPIPSETTYTRDIPTPTPYLKKVKGCPSITHIDIGAVIFVPEGVGEINIHSIPDTNVVTTIGKANDLDTMKVLDGPECVDNWILWKVLTDAGVQGWIPEGDVNGNFFLLPYPSYQFCEGFRPLIFHQGDKALLLENEANQRIRSEPNLQSSISGIIYKDHTLEIIDGPLCEDGFVWWKIRVMETEEEGWTAEGNQKDYFLLPIIDRTGAFKIQ